MKVRKVVTRSGRKYKGYFPSRKLGRMVEWESMLEREAILLIEHSLGVLKYQEQPELIEYEQDGEIRKYYPDFSVVLVSGEFLHIEVKPADQFKSPELVEKFTAIKTHYDRAGREFKILLDTQIRNQPRLRNLELLSKFSHRMEIEPELKQEIIQIIKSTPDITIRFLSAIYGLAKVLTLIAHSHIYCDMNIDLMTEQNILNIPTEGDHEQVFF